MNSLYILLTQLLITQMGIAGNLFILYLNVLTKASTIINKVHDETYKVRWNNFILIQMAFHIYYIKLVIYDSGFISS